MKIWMTEKKIQNFEKKLNGLKQIKYRNMYTKAKSMLKRESTYQNIKT